MRAEKELLLNEIKHKIDSSKGMIVAKYDRLEPNLSWRMREQIAKEGGHFRVVGKRVFLAAAKQAGVQFDADLLQGHIGVVFVSKEDATSTIKAVCKFSTENGDLLKVLCGQLEGKIVPGAHIDELSKLPTLNEMRAIFLSLLVSPMSQMLSVLDAKVQSQEATN